MSSTQDILLREAAQRRREQRKMENERLRKLCDGERTMKDIANHMGWDYSKVRERLRKLGLKTKRDV